MAVLPRNLVGERFGRLTVIAPTDSPLFWKAKCDCGNTKVIRGASMVSGNTRSCGCLVRSNPGRPRRAKYEPHIPLDTIVADTFEHLSPIRHELARYGVIIRGNGELKYDGKTEQYRDAYEALGHALIKTIQHPHREPKPFDPEIDTHIVIARKSSL